VCPDGWWLLESAWVAVRLAGLAIVAALAVAVLVDVVSGRDE